LLPPKSPDDYGRTGLSPYITFLKHFIAFAQASLLGRIAMKDVRDHGTVVAGLEFDPYATEKLGAIAWSVTLALVDDREFDVGPAALTLVATFTAGTAIRKRQKRKGVQKHRP
jgi:hypothetical protein